MLFRSPVKDRVQSQGRVVETEEFNIQKQTRSTQQKTYFYDTVIVDWLNNSGAQYCVVEEVGVKKSNNSGILWAGTIVSPLRNLTFITIWRGIGCPSRNSK